jgi:hypothetical protein
MKLKKGALYAAFNDGILNAGYYLGHVPGWYLFQSSDFSQDYGKLSNGVREEHIKDWLLIEIPGDPTRITEVQLFEHLKAVLPE